MTILHICNDFSYSKVHTNLYKNLDIYGLQQIIYHPLRKIDNIGKNVFSFNVVQSKIIYSRVLKKHHRLFFRRKIDYLYKDIINKIDLKNINYQLSTTLFSDGALAYKIFKDYNIPYVVTLRNTDINLFLRVHPDLYVLAKKILLNSNKIIFISPSLKDVFFKNRYFSKIEKYLDSKIEIIPNGIDNFWLENINIIAPKTQNEFLFIGRFDSNKNVIRLINSLENNRKQFPDIKLNLIGGYGNKHDDVLTNIRNKNWIKYHGKIHDKNKLKDIFSHCDFFAMPSIHETFGLVYIEALSQGLPVLYTKGQGVDGIFEKEVGIATNPKNETQISYDISWMIENRKFLADNIKEMDFARFDWTKISLRYKRILEEMVK